MSALKWFRTGMSPSKRLVPFNGIHWIPPRISKCERAALKLEREPADSPNESVELTEFNFFFGKFTQFALELNAEGELEL